MNRFMKEHGETFHLTQILRDQMLDILGDDDLRFQPGGNNLTLGGLCRQMGEMEQAYVSSLKTLKHDWSYRYADTTVENSVANLRDWYKSLDTELKALMDGFSDDDLSKMVDRGGGFQIPVGVQLHIYREGLLIFYGKAGIYLKALGKTLPQQWREWIW